jgi:predicted nucleic acid-binding protein
MPTPGNSLLLDTSVFVKHFRYPTALVDKLAEYEELYLPQPALGELYYGPKLSLLKLDPVTQARITNLLIRIIKVQ